VPVLCECIRILCSTVWVFPWFCVFWVVVCVSLGEDVLCMNLYGQ